MLSFTIPALLVSLGLSLAMAILGGLLTGNQLTRWFPTLNQPRFQLPLWAFMSVGIIVYIFDTVITYRLLTLVADQTDRFIALTALGIVMLYNELWNVVLFRWHNPFAGFLGVLAFLAPLLILQMIVLLVEPISAFLMFTYVLWVILYDIPWSYTLWKLNLSLP
jgi:translocator protein